MNPGEFEEVQLIGSLRVVKRIEAKLFPEKTFIHDLVFDYAAMAEEIGEAEYEQIRPLKP